MKEVLDSSGWLLNTNKFFVLIEFFMYLAPQKLSPITPLPWHILECRNWCIDESSGKRCRCSRNCPKFCILSSDKDLWAHETSILGETGNKSIAKFCWLYLLKMSCICPFLATSNLLALYSDYHYLSLLQLKQALRYPPHIFSSSSNLFSTFQSEILSICISDLVTSPLKTFKHFPLILGHKDSWQDRALCGTDPASLWLCSSLISGLQPYWIVFRVRQALCCALPSVSPSLTLHPIPPHLPSSA